LVDYKNNLVKKIFFTILQKNKVILNLDSIM